jgi:hypothetical protein
VEGKDYQHQGLGKKGEAMKERDDAKLVAEKAKAYLDQGFN